MLEFCGVDWENFPEHERTGHPELLRPARDAALPGQGLGPRLRRARTASRPEPWPTFLARTPYNAAAREAIARIQTDDSDRPDRAPSTARRPTQEKKAILSRLTYRRWLMEYIGRQRAGDHPVPAARPQPARRRRPGRLGGRHVGARQPRLPRPRALDDDLVPRHRPHAAVRAEPDRRGQPEPHLAGRQRLADAAARRQADPRQHRRRRRRPAHDGDRSSTRRPTTRSWTGRATASASASTASSSASSPASGREHRPKVDYLLDGKAAPRARPATS